MVWRLDEIVEVAHSAQCERLRHDTQIQYARDRTRGAHAPFDGMQAVASLDAAMAIAARDGDELCVIGGGEIYALALPMATHMHLTHVDTVVDGADAFFPAFEANQWCISASVAHAADSAHAFAFDFVDYARI